MPLPNSTPLDAEQIEQNFREIAPPLTDAEALFEANRCVYCFDAPCTRACPTHIDVPAFIKVMVSVSVLLTVAAVVLMFSSARRPTAVTD